MDDVELFNRTEQGRDVNRHHYTPAEIEQALSQPVSQAIMALARIRKLKAFDGSFSWAVTGHDSIELRWDNDDDSLSLKLVTAVGAPAFVIESRESGVTRRFASVAELAQA